MAILKIARMGHPVLVQRAEPIVDPSAEQIRRLVADMTETMLDAEGIGLAAPQVHRSLRLILFLDAEERDEAQGRRPLALINPEIEPLDDALEPGWEGCLSIPGLRGIVPRYRPDRLPRPDAGWRAPSSARRRACTPEWCSTRSIISTASSTRCACLTCVS